MSWRYTSSYIPRDLSSSRDSSAQNKYGGVSSLASKFGSSATERQSRWSKANSSPDPPKSFRTSSSSGDHGPIWAKTSISDNPSSIVQRLKERYSSADSASTSPKRAETKDLSTSLPRTYGRTTTSLSVADNATEAKKEPAKDYSYSKSYSSGLKNDNELDGVYSRFRRKPEKSPEPEKTTSYEYRTRRPEYGQTSNYGPLENRSKIYTSSSLGSSPSTTRYLTSTRKYSNDPPTSYTSYADRYSRTDKPAPEKTVADKREVETENENTMTVVTRGTSPTQPSASVYVRTRRADAAKGVETSVLRPKTKPETEEKECQTEKQEESGSGKYGYGDSNARVKPWSSYLDKYSSTGSSYGSVSRYPRSGFGTETRSSIHSSHPRSDTYSSYSSSRYDASDYKRSVSREEKEKSAEESSKSKCEELKIEPPVTAKTFALKTSEETKLATAVIAKPPETAKPPASKAIEEPKKMDATFTLKAPAPKICDELKKEPTVTAKPPIAKPCDEIKKTDKAEKPPASKICEELKKVEATLAAKPLKTKKSVSPSPLRKSPSIQSEMDISSSDTQSKSSSLQFQMSDAEKSPLGDKIKSPTQNGVSSSSESSSEEESTSSDSESEEAEQPTTSETTSSIKKSITNFLQNIPNILRKPTSSAESVANRSKSNLYQKLASQAGSVQKMQFKRIESGERAWWMDSNERIPDGIAKVLSNRSVGKSEPPAENRYIIPKQYSTEEWWLKDEDDRLPKSNNQSRSSVKNLPPKAPSNTLLAPPYLINRQYSRDKDWLRGSTDDIDNSASIIKQCNGDNTWWIDSNDNITVDTGSVEWPKEIEGNINEILANSMSLQEGFSDRKSADVKYSGKDDSINEAVCDQVSSSWLSDGLNIAQVSLSNGVKETFSPERNNNLQIDDGEEEIDVTPALRRRREQQQHSGSKSPDTYHLEDINGEMKFNHENTTETGNEGKKYLEDFTLECSVKDITQKLVNQNGLSSPLEEKNNNLLEVGDMSGMISKAKAGLMKSKSKLDVKKSSSGEMSPKITDLGKSEIDLYWKELVDSIDRPLRLCDLDFTDLNTDDETDLLGNRRVANGVPPPPPLLMMPLPRMDLNVPAPPSQRNMKAPAPPPMNQIVKNKKTVKLFWKEVKDDPVFQLQLPGGVSLIWDELARVVVDTQKLEHLFESRAKDLITKKQQEQNKSKEVIVLDHKRSNAINIGMTKLPPPRAIKTAILKMDSTVVNKEGIEKLLTMLPTEEERLRIQDAQCANPDLPLGSAEQFLLTLASINELEARLKLWAFKLDFENSEKEICEPLMDLKQGIEILKLNKTFHGILSTLLSIGNFLNGYDAKGFQIDYLSKVPEVKDTVHKHSLLHHLCVIVMEKFPDSTDLYSEIGAVTRASKVDFDELSANIKKVEDECKLSWNHLKMIAKHEGHTTMKMKMSDFLADCAERIIVLGVVHKRVISRFQKFIFWLGIPMNRISTTRPNEIFKIISEFALEYRTTRERVLQQVKKINHRERSKTRGYQFHENNEIVTKKMNSKEAKDDAKLRQLLGNDTTHSENMHRSSTWRRQRRETRNLPITEANHNDDEIIETLIKTANQIPSSRSTLKERRRSRIDRKLCKYCTTFLDEDHNYTQMRLN